MRSKSRTIAHLVTMTLLTALLTGCSGYSSKFACGSSSGAKCIMIGDVDKMIDSGEIEEYHERRKCKASKKCIKTLKPKLQRT